jgi:hypothetical protein
MQSRALTIVVLLLFVAPAALAGSPQDRIKQHVHDMVQEVKQTDDPQKKRAIMERDLSKMVRALDRVAAMDHISEADRAGINQLRTQVQDYLDELSGHDGFTPVPDRQLNNFADYVQQSFEQADRTITISITTALLILILLILLL